eukprot:GEMP01028574.1.p1 GENE.GEMP01028574.1~~GEMP01028574.1.p1  ORF type:complete len:547 (+),score=129.82 GEMP01028574.1:159-1799(+)
MEFELRFDKVIDWALTRRLIPNEWPAILKGLRKITQEALDEVSERTENVKVKEVVADDRSPSYRTAELIYQLICDSPEGDKNMLGFHSHPVAKQWRALVQNFKRKNMYICDYAKYLLQVVRYDFSAKKKEIQHITTQLTDTSRRQQDNEKQRPKLLAKYAEATAKYSIDDNTTNFRTALLDRVAVALPEQIARSVECIQDSKLSEIIEFYRMFSEYTADSNMAELPILQKIVKSGNPFLRDALDYHESLPEAWERVQASFQSERQKQLSSQHDGDALSAAAVEISECGINLGAEPPADAEGPASGINWDVADSAGNAEPPPQEGIQLGTPEAPVEEGIHWDASADIANTAHDDEWEDVMKSSMNINWDVLCCEGFEMEPEEKTATAEDVDLLSTSAGRHLVIMDLLELEGFLLQRLAQQRHKSFIKDSLSRSETEIQDYLNNVQRALRLIDGSEIHALSLMKIPRFLDNAVANLETRKELCSKPDRIAQSLEVKRAQLQKDLARCHENLSALRKDGQNAKAQLEEALSSLVRPHRCKLVGDVDILA